MCRCMKFATIQDHLGCGKELAIERAAEMGLDGIEWLIPDGVHNVGADGMHLDMTGLDTDADEVPVIKSHAGLHVLPAGERDDA